MLHNSKPLLVSAFNPSEKYEFVSWGYYSQYMKNMRKKHVPNHQPDEQLPGALIAEEILPQGTFHQFQLQLCLGVRRPAVQA